MMASNRFSKSKGFNERDSNTSTMSNNAATGGIIKTVILPFDEINSLKAELEHLKQFRASQKALFEAAIQGYQKDKLIRLQEANLRQQDFNQSIKELEGRLAKRDKDGYEISKNFFQYKHDVQKSKDKLNDEKELLLIEKRALEDQMAKLKERSINDKEYAKDLYSQKTENFAQRFRQLTHKNENDLKVIRVQYEQFCTDSKQELKDMEAKIQMLSLIHI